MEYDHDLDSFVWTDENKYLLIRSIEDRIFILEKLIVNDKSINVHDSRKDIDDLKKIKGMFSSELYK
jgi:hypothetical protein